MAAKIPRSGFLWWAFWACLSAVFLYFAIFGPRKTAQGHPFDCTPLVSIDGTKELHVYDDRTVVLWDDATKDASGKDIPVEGKWDFDETTKLYAVTLSGEVTTYSFVNPPVGPCMLVKGDLSAADIRASWFAKF